jgi:hypothetical protein
VGSRPVCELQKGCSRLAAASDEVYQLLAYGQWFSPGTPASSTTKTCRHDIAEILLKVAIKHKNQSKSNDLISTFVSPFLYYPPPFFKIFILIIPFPKFS